jgi:RNA polymerase sigma factor (sigma-70 family)
MVSFLEETSETTGAGEGGGRVVGDPLEELFREQFRPMLRIACAVLGDVGGAEDAVQEAFAGVSTKLGRLSPSEQVPYLRQAVMNNCRLTWRRAGARKRQPVLSRVASDSLEDHAVDTDRRGRIAVALNTLPWRQRQCLTLRYYSELSDSEIAAAIGVSVGSVKTHLRRGLHALQSSLEDQR